MFLAAGNDAEKNKSVAPAENENPALNPTAAVITVNTP